MPLCSRPCPIPGHRLDSQPSLEHILKTHQPRVPPIPPQPLFPLLPFLSLILHSHTRFTPTRFTPTR